MHFIRDRFILKFPRSYKVEITFSNWTLYKICLSNKWQKNCSKQSLTSGTKWRNISLNKMISRLFRLKFFPPKMYYCFFWGALHFILTFLHSHHGWESIGFMWKMTLEIFIKSLRFETPWVRKKGFYESVCLSVVGRGR